MYIYHTHPLIQDFLSQRMYLIFIQRHDVLVRPKHILISFMSIDYNNIYLLLRLEIKNLGLKF